MARIRHVISKAKGKRLIEVLAFVCWIGDKAYEFVNEFQGGSSMPWMFKPGVDYGVVYGEWVGDDGLDWSDEEGSGRPVTLDQAADFSGYARGAKRACDHAYAPKYFALERHREKFADFFRLRGGIWILSQAFADIIRELDGDAHFIWPIEIRRYKQRNRVQNAEYHRYDGSFYGFVPGVHTECLDEEGSDVFVIEEKHYKGDPAPTPRSVNFFSEGEAMINMALAPEAHFWRDHTFAGSLFLFSDELHARIKEAGLKVIPKKKLKVKK